MKSHKVILLCIDGATFNIILPMIEKGELPTFKNLMETGTWGELMSTYPPHTVPAWISCATGMNPGKFGLFDFRKDSHLTYDEGRVASSSDIKAKPIWDLLSERERKVTVVAIPLTYPPVPVNGIMISPVRLIEPDKIKTYPPELADELFEKFEIRSALRKRKDFMEIHTARVESDLEKFLDTTVASAHLVIEKLTEVTLYLLAKYEYDFGMFMLPIDALQHHLWCFMDAKHPAYDPELAHKYEKSILEGYQCIDAALHKIVSQIDDDTTLILVSDHGFGPLHKIFHLNRWLMEQGLLKLKRGNRYSFVPTRIPLSSFLQRIGLGFIARRLPEEWKIRRIPVIKRKPKTLLELIDWQHTKAYATSYALNINLKGREPQGIVEPGEEYNALIEYIQKELSTLKDPDTGQQIIERILEKKELYSGPYTEDAPDVLLFFKDPRYAIRKELLYPALFRKLNPEDRMTGHHTSFPKGICIIKGPHIVSKSKPKGMEIIDIAPTVLYLMGEPIPEGMDGRVITEIINPEYLKLHPPTIGSYCNSLKESSLQAEELTEAEEEIIKKRLSDLGYMG